MRRTEFIKGISGKDLALKINDFGLKNRIVQINFIGERTAFVTYKEGSFDGKNRPKKKKAAGGKESSEQKESKQVGVRLHNDGGHRG